jgi:hypothetical protein
MIEPVKNLFGIVFLNLKIKHKLLLAFSFIIIIPTVVLSTVYYHWTKGLLRSQTISTSVNVLEQTKALLTARIDSVRNIFLYFINDYELLKKIDPAKRVYSSEAQLEDFAFLTNYIQNMEYVNDVFKIRLYMRSSSVYTRRRTDVFDLSEITDTDYTEKRLRPTEKYTIQSRICRITPTAL